MDATRSCPLPVSILMPVCNEADIIERSMEEWIEEVFRHLPEGSEFLIEEAASSDGTRDILERLMGKYPFIRVSCRDEKDGFGPAASRLYGRAKCPLVFFSDADGQYVPSEFWKLVPFVHDFAVVHGAKIGRQDSFFRKAASAVFNRIARFTFDVHLSDINSAFRIIRRDALLEILPALRCMPTLLNAELLLRAALLNYPIKQVFVRHRRREFGVSRGLPTGAFLRESLRAYRGLMALKDEFKLP